MNIYSINFRLLVGGCLTVLLPLLIVGLITTKKSSDALQRQAMVLMQNGAIAIANLVNTNLSKDKNIALAYASDSQVREVSQKVNESGTESAEESVLRLRQAMKKLYAHLGKEYHGVFVTDATGELYTGERSDGSEYKGSNVSARGYFQEAKRIGKPVVGDMVKSKSTGQLVVVTCAPVFSDDGTFLGIFGMVLNASALTDIVNRVKIGKTGYALMVNERGVLIAHPNQDYLLTLNLAEEKGMKSITTDMLAGKAGSAPYTFKGTDKFAGFAPVSLKGWGVVLTQNRNELFASAVAIRNSFLLITFLALACVGSIIYFFSRTITEPINQAVERLRDIAEGDGNPTKRLPVTTRDEVGEMARWFNKLIEKALLINKNIFDKGSIGIYRIGADSKILDVNKKAAAILGYNTEELKNKYIIDIDSELTSDNWSILWDKLSAITSDKFETLHLHKNGSLVPVEVTINLLEYDSHQYSIAFVQDITDRKRMEQVLRDSEERFRTLHNASFGGIVIHEKGTILDCNQGLSDITGYTFDELIGTNGLRLIAPESLEEVTRKMLSEAEEPYEVQGIRKDGTTYPLYLQSKLIPYKGRTVRVGEFRDISDLKNAEQEKTELTAQLHQARKMESVGQLAGGVAHDFNNMLTAILGHAQIAMISCSPSESVHSHLKGIQEAALRSADLVKQLLTFARKQTIAPKILDVNEMSTSILKMLHRVIGEDIDLSWLPGSNLWQIKMDPSQVDQLLVNLCVNARDAITGVGKISIETKNITLDHSSCGVNSDFIPGDYVMLAVSDNGSGMNKETQEHIFEPFFTTKEIGKGTGLGMATVYGVVKQNNGFINVYSELDKGTTFRIYLPRFSGEGISEPIGIVKEAPKGQGEVVLLVEDEAAIREVAQTLLSELGYVVLIAGTPGEAVKLAKKHTAKLRLLITDVIMPEMNGRELEKLIREIKPDMKCLYCSGYTADIIAHHGVLDENVCFLQKPFSMEDLAFKVREALEQKYN
ncbi:PAS domain S-box protein [Desulfosediminicola flagellatus]|uniref:PAS domain S-box protein n=1 Tax=Desulfosediminicola flagellatus TaxID=2569541 RepID=UPI0010ACF4F1|nr:PAS domain S-box protein [Desulfosediminicola flagellatus]